MPGLAAARRRRRRARVLGVVRVVPARARSGDAGSAPVQQAHRAALPQRRGRRSSRELGPLVHPWLTLADEIVVPSTYLAWRVRQVRLSRARDSECRRSVGVRLSRASSAAPASALDAKSRAVLPGRHHHRGVRAAPRRACPDATLTIAGYGSEEPHLRAMAAQLTTGGVRFRRQGSAGSGCRSCTPIPTSS